MKDFILGFFLGFILTVFGAGLYVNAKMAKLSQELDKLEQVIDKTIDGIGKIGKIEKVIGNR